MYKYMQFSVWVCIPFKARIAPANVVVAVFTVTTITTALRHFSSLFAAVYAPQFIMHKYNLLIDRTRLCCTLWILCVWVITIISINDGKHFAVPCLSNHLFIKAIEEGERQTQREGKGEIPNSSIERYGYISRI